jgi:hypothetical protein
MLVCVWIVGAIKSVIEGNERSPISKGHDTETGGIGPGNWTEQAADLRKCWRLDKYEMCRGMRLLLYCARFHTDIVRDMVRRAGRRCIRVDGCIIPFPSAKREKGWGG